MHRALEIPEITSYIVSHCCLRHSLEERSDLAALARTSRAFCQPALDVLWEKLDNLVPLVLCLPEECRQTSEFPNRRHSLRRSLTQAEWEILRNYTRRTRSMTLFHTGLDQKSIEIILKPHASEPLFPNLRYLSFTATNDHRLLLLQPFQNLVSLSIMMGRRVEPRSLEGSFQSFVKNSPQLKRLRIHQSPLNKSRFDTSIICRWKYLQSFVCDGICLDADALVQLSRLPALTLLVFPVDNTLTHRIPPSRSPLPFSSLHELRLYSGSLSFVSSLTSCVQMPTVTTFYVSFGDRPSKEDITSFFINLQTSNIGHTVQELRVTQSAFAEFITDWKEGLPVLGFEDLQPCMAFRNLRLLVLDVDLSVYLTEDELLRLTSAWYALEELQINMEWGWKSMGGITPNGLLRLRQQCPSLSRITLAIDTRLRGCVEPLQSHSLVSPPISYFNVVDSFIEAESIPFISAFFAAIAPRSRFDCSEGMHEGCGTRMPHWEKSYILWYEVFDRVEDICPQPAL